MYGPRFLPLAACAIALASVAGPAYGEGVATSKPAKPAPKTASRAPAASAKRPGTPPGPVAASKVWHTPAPGKSAPLDTAGRPMLTLQALNMPDHVTLTASSEHGGFAAEDLDRAARVLRDPRTGNEHPVDPRVLDLVYRVAVHFSAHEVRIISGYRTPRNGSHSNHGRGRAIDLVVPGASDEDVARFAREQGFVGVGVYPVSGFVHLDVRERSYFWVDSSGPGKRNRTRGILADLAAKSDARALARGEHGIGPFSISTDVDSALAQVVGASGANAPVIEDDDVDEGAVSP
jgi:uncharacterized protein YcbK (DUF882 family)